MNSLKNNLFKISDSSEGNFVDRYFPNWSVPYLRLSRADRPTGTWLLLLPCWFGILLAYNEKNTSISFYEIWLLIACGLGAFLMRGAGCTWNDILDKKYDARVERTKNRPIPSGQVTILKAFIWMAVQSLLAFLILLTFNKLSIFIACLSLFLVAIYPLAKRITWWPQIFLGLAFNWGVLVGYSASLEKLSIPVFFMYFACIFWTLFYDTIYALQDIKDDSLIGVKSTARLFGNNIKYWLYLFIILFLTLFVLGTIPIMIDYNFHRLIILFIGTFFLFIHLTLQVKNLNIVSTNSALKTFKSNRNTGFILVFTLIGISI